MKDEPIAWWNERLRIHWQDAVSDTQEGDWTTPLYMKPQYKELSDEDILAIGDYFDYPVTDIDDKKWFLEMARKLLKKAIEK